jgi:membrane fusion protein (multidrug efflux system)
MSNELMTLVATDTIYFEATAPETALPYLREGGRAEVSLDARPGSTYPGVIRQIIPVSEGDARALRLRISIPRPDGAGAVVGGFARAVVRGESRSAALTVPRTAIVSDEGEMAVFVLDGEVVRRRLVRIDGGDGERVEILSGLRAGETVVVEGAQGLEDGQHVSIQR